MLLFFINLEAIRYPSYIIVLLGKRCNMIRITSNFCRIQEGKRGMPKPRSKKQKARKRI